MTSYLCKCGRKVQKSTNADNTGNRDTAGCMGCPYLMPWGPTAWDNTRHAVVVDIKGYECRMSPSLEYRTELSGNLDDKTTLRIASLDFDFLEKVSAWVKDHYPGGELSGRFSREDIRAVEYVDNGRYRYVLCCVQNKKGIAAKRALWAEFFDETFHRKDMTPEQEKAKVLEDIKRGIALAQTVERPTSTSMTEHAADVCKAEAEQAPVFDYSVLDDDTAEKLRGITECVMDLYQSYAWGMAYQVGRAHDLLCGKEACKTVLQAHKRNNQYSENTFTAWCTYIGVNRQTAYNMLNAYKLIRNASPEQQKHLQAAPAKLLYEAGKAAAPEELVTAVMDGDITTHKQYQELLAEIRTRDAKISELIESSEASDRRADAAEKRAREAERMRDGARDALQAAKLRGDKWQAEAEALKAHPIEAQVVDEEEINRRAKDRAAELTAPLREELEALRNRHPADPEAAEQAIRDAYDSTIYTGRVIENAWHTLRPLLPCMDVERRELAINNLSKIITMIQGEIAACL